ncbi:receptor-like cytosolic serine/threonine-protein kinase RBK2 isoform X3 [Nicotiana tomentosiformis]|uniref:receptor-like cytosolic serine/threonine-protein kinase RBK2 isoform X3 n=1 Tax=Nicotiana tomentosiformis TaxID=4098 RepID=UPI00388C9569
MENDKHDDSSPRGIIEACIRNQENGSDSPKAKPSGSHFCLSNPRMPSRWHKFFKMWKRSSIKRLPTFPPLAVPRISRRKSRSARENVATGFYHFKSSWKNFSLSDLKNATNNFSEGSRDKLDWAARYKIIFGIANGLLYLHENCQRRIIHRDIKADNILLTEDFVPQICDFGLAKWLPKEWTHHNVGKFEGTFGYFAPEYFMHGIVDEKTDVFSFGVLLLEIITGRQALDDSQQSLVLWAKPLLDKHDMKGLIDPVLGDKYNPKEMRHVILTAGLCVEQNPLMRPRMNQVMVLLRTDDGYNKKCMRRTYSEELLDAAEYNSTKCLHDLKQLKLRNSVSEDNIKTP